MPARLAILAVYLFVAGCAAPPTIDQPASVPEIPDKFPVSVYQAANVRGEWVYSIDATTSLIRVFAYRAGSMSRMGHDHVIASRAIRGFALNTPIPDKQGAVVQADLYMPLFSMTVDEESLRAEAGFKTDVSERARSGTRSNMLASLDAAAYPHVIVHIEGTLDKQTLVATEVPLRVTVTLHGVTSTIEVLALVSVDADDLQAEGRFSLQQSDFGIKPHSALGGALAVRDELDIAFQIGATREPVW
ncbi:MAG: YceI family protein [Gammaproteobacteria bacterium]|nr:YceI family protein [Gammaproteobacteria bacterium]